MFSEYESSYRELRRLRFHLVENGPADGPLVVFLHGLPEFWYGCRGQIRPFSQAGYRMIVPDQRGYNLSDKPEGIAAYGIDELVDDVVALAGRLGLQNGSRWKIFRAGQYRLSQSVRYRI